MRSGDHPDLSTSLRASVVICAYTERRWGDLAASVEHLLRGPDDPPHEVIVVVDNNPDLLRRVQHELEGVVVAANEGSRGLSGARNTGVARASGDVIIFLDDDAVPAPGWLAHLLAPYRDPAVMGVGGGADPVWPGERPRWFPSEFAWVVGCSWTGLPDHVAQVRNLIGCNMSFRREALEIAGEFREDIGRIGTRPLGCEETELCIRLRQRQPSSVLLYDPLARVDHRVSPDRIRWRYFSSRCFAEGLSKAMVTDAVGSRDGLAAERAHTLRVLPRGVWRGLTDVGRGDPAGLGRAGAIVAGLAYTSAGYVRGRVAPRRPRAARAHPTGSAPDERATETRAGANVRR
jgi:glycosyltransferase involved in cell wall biosynthesis